MRTRVLSSYVVIARGTWWRTQDTLDARRHMPCFERTTFGHECTVTSRGTSNDALHAYKLSPNLLPLVSICLYLFHMHHGRILAWISFWVCHGHEMDMTQYLWLLTVFPKWPTLFHVTRPTMLHILLICFSGKSFDFMGFQQALCRIATSSS
jgi:hypothetical protein